MIEDNDIDITKPEATFVKGSVYAFPIFLTLAFIDVISASKLGPPTHASRY